MADGESSDQAAPAPPAPPPPDTGDADRDRFKSAVATLIAVVTLTGAVLAAKAAVLESEASGTDRQAILEAVEQQLVTTRANTELNQERSSQARFRAELTAAEELDKAAADAQAVGRQPDAESLQAEARSFSEVARTLANLSFDTSYLQGTGGDSVLDLDRRRTDLERRYSPNPPNPRHTADEADVRHERAERVLTWLVVLAASLTMLTVAEFAGGRIRRGLAGAGVMIYLTALAGFWA